MNVQTKGERPQKLWRNEETLIVFQTFYYDEEQKRHWTEAARAARAEAPRSPRVTAKEWDMEESALYLLADRMRREVEGGFPGVASSLHECLVNHVLSEVAWVELAEFFLRGSVDDSGS